MTSSPDNDRRVGALLGLTIGDALGAAVEFKPPGTFEPVTGYRGGGPHRLNAGEWTDDTSLALALADSRRFVARASPIAGDTGAGTIRSALERVISPVRLGSRPKKEPMRSTPIADSSALPAATGSASGFEINVGDAVVDVPGVGIV